MITKKIITRNTVVLALFLCMIHSCEEALEVNPPINQINANQVFESTSTADAALSSLYAELQAYSLLSGSSSGAGALLGSYTDELVNYSTASNADFDIFSNSMVSTNTKIKSVWANAYKEIYMANAIIEGVNKSTAIADLDKKRIKGEALFVRALIYYYISQIFGAIPYVTTTDYTVNQSLAKTNETELLVKIQNDLSESSSLLNDIYRNPDRIYPNKKTADLLLASVLMTQNHWQDAEILLKGIIQNALYTWQPDLSKTFKMNGKHILWQLKPLQANNATSEALLYYFTTALPNTYTLSDNLFASFDTNDLRKQQWIKTLTINQKNYYRTDKYRNISANTDEYSIVFRLEETYLLLAESLAQQDKKTEALTYLNAVKAKAGITATPVSATKEQILSEIINENRKEFFTEKGIRFLSLKRAGKLNGLLSTKPNWKTYHQNWPLPNSELLLNPHLNPQNDGY
ncbi:RagB/SusD family nutrient uptake outer membrane protein [Chryseobacterium gotjawalense]|uniref:RagB/SusD family nutrient uptake outer membrane protein n=1 Tax=Chryseobacterium gotjawalense TaxID=3042315 RepID=A0ABY8RBW9_9FLAO|nr:RagB/SusD family nutrient uptake outer membrane protein [Chryseobacterium sp. wdc7]WHF51467.1 RagB/SusD family nutrient uptake outer membrane protein [Chryseobacterium sp. wdc7]WHF51888.1 RagB/SusD family nutrient uptake outer membrane protein [Chryseobacterium sp. wdc7]